MGVLVPTTPRKRPAYPISDTAEKFEASLCKIKAAGEHALDLIRETKAYKGGNDPLWALRELDDADKHRALITVGMAQGGVGIDMGKFLADLAPDGPIPSLSVFLNPADRQYPLEGNEELFRIPASSQGAKQHPDPEITFDVALGEPEIFEGRTPLEAAIELRDVVESIIDSFALYLASK